MSRRNETPEGATMLADACRIGDEIAVLREQVTALVEQRRHLWLDANREGVTYQRIQQECGVSDAYVCKEIRAARLERTPLETVW